MNLLNKLSGISTKQKMYAGFGGVMLIMLVVSIQNLIGLGTVSSATNEVFDEYQPTTIQVMRLSAKLQESLSALGFYLLSKEDLEKDQYDKSIKDIDELITSIESSSLYSNDEQVKQHINTVETILAELKLEQAEIIKVSTDRSLNFRAASLAQQNINPINQEALQDIDIMLRSEYEEYSDSPRIEIISAAGNLRYAWVRMMSDLRAYLGFRSPGNIDQILIYTASFRQELDKLESLEIEYTFEQEEVIEKLRGHVDNYDKELQEIINVHSSDSWRKDSYIYRTSSRNRIMSINTEFQELISYLDAKTRELGKNASLTASATGTTSILLLVIAMIAIVSLSLLLSRGIIKPMTSAVDRSLTTIHDIMDMMGADTATMQNIEYPEDEIEKVEKTLAVMTDTLAELAEKQVYTTTVLREKINTVLNVVENAANGDLTGHIDLEGGDDDVDFLAAGVQQMVDSLNQLVAQVQQSGIQVTSSATEIAATSKQQEATVTEQAASTNQIMATAAEISATTQELANTMGEVSSVADNTASSAAEGQTALTNMEKTMHQMHEATTSIASKLAVLSEKASNINTVVTTITKVADQTNLLSLNAAIEAEKAGEYGLGFAVVATEIRRLADQTAVATWDIEQMVKEMQTAVSAGVMGMDKFSEEVNRGVTEVQQIGSQLADIIDQVQTLTPRFDLVNEGMQSQSRGAQQISEGMVQLNEAAQQTVESIRQSTLSLESLKDAAQDLQTGVSIFRVK